MGISSSGHLIAQIYISSAVTGPVLPTNVWTHVVYTYSAANGIRLYISGTLYGTASVSTLSGNAAQMYVLLANPVVSQSGCANSNIVMAQYYGGIDEFRLFSRELSSSDVCTLSRQ
jgi:hypothetical protein